MVWGTQMEHSNRLPAIRQFFLSHLLLIIVMLAALLISYVNCAGIIRRHVSQTTQSEVDKAAELFEMRLEELRDTAYTIAHNQEIVSLGQKNVLYIDDYSALSSIDKALKAEYLSSKYLEELTIYFERSGSAWTSSCMLERNSGFLDPALTGTKFQIFGGASVKNFFTSLPASNLFALPDGRLIFVQDLYALSNYRLHASAAFLLDDNYVSQLFSFEPYYEAGASFELYDQKGNLISRQQGDESDGNTLCIEGRGNGYVYRLNVPESYLYKSVLSGGLIVSLASIIIAVAVSLVLAIILSRINVKPVNQLLVLSEAKTGTGKNEYSALHESISRLKRDSARMTELSEQQSQLQKSSVFTTILRYGYQSEDMILDALADAEIIPDDEAYAAVPVKTVDCAFDGQLSQKALLGELLSSLVGGVLYTYTLSADTLVLFCGLKKGQTVEYLAERVEKAIDEARRSFTVVLSAFIGPAVSRLIELPDSLKAAQNEMRRQYVPPAGYIEKVYVASPVEARESAGWRIPEKMRYQVMELCKAGDRDALRELLDSFLNDCQKPVPSILDIRQLGFDFRNTLLELEEQYPGSCDDEAITTISTLPNVSDMEALYSVLLSLLNGFCEKTTAHQESTAHKLYNDIREYVISHYTDPDMSLSLIAGHFGINDKYLSQFYKKEGGTNLASDIEQLRMKKAAELILTTDNTQAEISEACGYSSLNSFYRAFKRFYAVSPGAYRSANNKG